MTQGQQRARPSVLYGALALAGMVAAIPAAHALELTQPDSDYKVTWNNTIRYALAFRTHSQDPALLRGPNFDDGDRNFNKGLVSNRLELLTELDAVSRQGGYGARLSAQGWYDSVYNSRNDNPGFAGGAFPNQTSVAFDQFTRTTRRLHGRDIELRDAFAFMKFDAADMPVTLRLGQHALVWGESLFFAGNAIAGAQSPFDISRLLADPTAQAKEFVLPVPQLSGQIQVSPDVSVGAYYQFKWKPNRFPAVGSYFSQSDIFGPGGENMWIGPGLAVPRAGDLEPKNSGQGGVQLRWHAMDTDFGLYALRFHDKSPQLATRLGLAPLPFPPGALAPMPVGFYQVYNQNTNAYAVSASRTFGEANVALEASLRTNQALASSGGTVDASALTGVPVDNSGNPSYAVGRTAHVNASVLWSLQPGALWREATLVGEVAWNRMLSCSRNCDTALDPNGKRDAVGLRMVFTPTYRQVAPGLDVSVPVGLGYSPKGSRSLALGPGTLPPAGGGDFTIGLSSVYQAAWHFNIAYTHFFGKADTLLSSDPATATAPPYTYAQSLKDRNFIALTVRHTF